MWTDKGPGRREDWGKMGDRENGQPSIVSGLLEQIRRGAMSNRYRVGNDGNEISRASKEGIATCISQQSCSLGGPVLNVLISVPAVLGRSKALPVRVFRILRCAGVQRLRGRGRKHRRLGGLWYDGGRGCIQSTHAATIVACGGCGEGRRGAQRALGIRANICGKRCTNLYDI